LCSIKFCIFINYQDQEAIVVDDILPPVPHSVPYLPARQLFLKTNIQYNNLGMLTVICSHYHALHFECEKLTFSRVNHPKFSIYYLQGQIQLPPLQPLTEILHNYLTGDDYPSKEFHNNI